MIGARGTPTSIIASTESSSAGSEGVWAPPQVVQNHSLHRVKLGGGVGAAAAIPPSSAGASVRRLRSHQARQVRHSICLPRPANSRRMLPLAVCSRRLRKWWVWKMRLRPSIDRRNFIRPGAYSSGGRAYSRRMAAASATRSSRSDAKPRIDTETASRLRRAWLGGTTILHYGPGTHRNFAPAELGSVERMIGARGTPTSIIASTESSSAGSEGVWAPPQVVQNHSLHRVKLGGGVGAAAAIPPSSPSASFHLSTKAGQLASPGLTRRPGKPRPSPSRASRHLTTCSAL